VCLEAIRTSDLKRRTSGFSRTGTEPVNAPIVTEFCTKRSVACILNSDQVSLDNVLRFEMALDPEYAPRNFQGPETAD
jgi:hypothetical protein